METNKKYFGNKTLHLEECQNQGLLVPRFFPLGANISKQLFEESAFRKKITQEIIHHLPAAKYAVRSSALSEDSDHSSLAGQFETKLSVAPADLEKALLEVLTQAHEYLHGNLDAFSLLIQEYIEPDFAGVVFTRSPLGKREMIVEYTKGTGERVVGGTIKPKKFCFYREETIPAELQKIGFTEKIRKNIYDLEGYYKFPQDIEWCIKDNEFYFLQTRAITTLQPKDYDQIIFLEKNIPAEPLYLEKTELTEVAPRPTPFTLSLLEKIYENDGPVSAVYKKHAISYHDTKFLYILGNEFFVDKEKEIQSILPNYTYFLSHTYTPKFRWNKKAFLSLKNIWQLNTLHTAQAQTFFPLLEDIFHGTFPNKIENAIEAFLKNYKITFEINIFAGVALKKLKFSLKKEKISCQEVLAASTFFLSKDEQPPLSFDIQNWKGNSLEISDESPCVTIHPSKENQNPDVENWWKTVSEWKKQQFKPKIITFLEFNRLREYGRIAVLKQIQNLRTILFEIAQKQNFLDLKNIYFCTLEEIIQTKLNEQKALERKKQYNFFNNFSFPSQITDTFVQKTTPLLGVSQGKAKGRIIKIEEIENHTKNEKIILYTKILSPDLTKYFSKIQGIVSQEGGMLSHLAIVAREHHIPVLVNFSFSEKIKPGDIVEIDGTTGTITYENFDSKIL